MTLLELLQASRVEEFNAKRGQRAEIDLFAADLANLSLVGVDLSGANLEKADLSGSDLTEANLSKANLVGADLTGAILDRCVAVRARMREIYLGEASAVAAEFSDADLTEADLPGFKAPKARFLRARAKGAVFTNATLHEADFTDARFHDADLRGADLDGAILRGAEFLRANFGAAQMVGVDAEGARFSGASFKAANLTEGKFIAADLSACDLSDATLEDANLERADLFDVQADAAALARARLPRGFTAGVEDDAEAPVELCFESPMVALSEGHLAVFWENPEGEDEVTLRIGVCAEGAEWDGRATVVQVQVDQVLARAVLPAPGGFICAIVVDKPGGAELLTVPLGLDGRLGTPKGTRIGYAPSVLPIFGVDAEGSVLLYGMGRQGMLSVHRWDGVSLNEVMRAPSSTYRGFCGRLDAVLLSRGGTVAAVRSDGIGKLITAPTGFPGRLNAAVRGDGDRVSLAWTRREERGLRVQRLGVDTEPLRLDATLDIGSLDLVVVGDRHLLLWTRESDSSVPMAAWLPGGKPFRLTAPDADIESDTVQVVASLGPPRVVLTGLGDEVVVLEVRETDAREVGRFRQPLAPKATKPPKKAPKK